MAEAAPLWRRAPGGFIPADPEAEEAFAATKVGEVVRMKPAKPRNVLHHRKYWALVNLCAKNADGWTAESLSDYLKVKTGHFTPMTIPVAPDVIIRKPKSISFAAMDQMEFEKFYDRALDVMVRWVVPHIPKQELRDAVELELVMA